jgi:hypothetical protein
MLDDTSAEALAVQLRELRRIGPAGRAAITFELCDNLRSLVAAGVRHRHPQWDDQAVKLEWTKGRESDVQYSDAVGVAAAQWGNLDMKYLHKWAEELGVRDRLIEALEQAKAESEQCDRES